MSKHPYFTGEEHRAGILIYIAEYKREHGFQPTIREICKHTRLSIGGVQFHLNKLKAEGKVDWKYNQPRTISIIGGEDGKQELQG